MISLSGIDCAGKSTQIALLQKHFSNKNIKIIWSRGGYTPGIAFIKDLLRNKNLKTNEEIAKNSEKINKNSFIRYIIFQLSLVDLLIYYSIVLRLYEFFGKKLICDRYIWDTYIDFLLKYPDYNFEDYIFWKLTLFFMLKPEISFILTIPAEESMRRSDLKEEPFPENIETRKKRINLYVTEINKNRWNYVVDASKSIELVFDDIKSRINENF